MLPYFFIHHAYTALYWSIMSWSGSVVLSISDASAVAGYHERRFIAFWRREIVVYGELTSWSPWLLRLIS